VNPSKETILAIAYSLRLSPTEISYALSINNTPTEQEINHAKKYFNNLLNSNKVFGYFLDNRSKILAFSKGFKKLGVSENIDLDKLIGKNIVELTFDPNLGIREKFPEDYFDDITIPVLAVLKQEREFMLDDPYWVDMFNELSKYPDFDRLWEQVQKIKIDLFSEEARTVYFNILEHSIAMVFHINILPLDPRFSFVEYIPKRNLTKMLIKILG